MNDKDAHMLRKFFPPAIFLYDEEEYIIPRDEMGFIYSKKEIEAWFKQIMKFYNFYSDEEINEYNNNLFEQYNPSYTNYTNSENTRKKPKKGFVYFIKAENGLIKIGRTKNLSNRYKQIQHSALLKTELLFAIESNDVIKLEQKLHHFFENKMEKGEWFALSNEDIEIIKNVAKKKGLKIIFIEGENNE